MNSLLRHRLLRYKDFVVNFVTKPSLLSLHKKLYKHLDAQSKKYNYFIYSEGYFYQGWNKIGITGCRPTEKRFKAYELPKYISKKARVLDIGTNCGFFLLHLSRFVRQVEGVEPNPYLIAIANDTKNFLKIKNAKFHKMGFEDFNPNYKFDAILSFANDETIDGQTRLKFIEYVNKIHNLLTPDGKLIFESQAIDYNDKNFAPKLSILEQKFKIVHKKRVESYYPYNIKSRIFLVLEKKSQDEVFDDLLDEI